MNRVFSVLVMASLVSSSPALARSKTPPPPEMDSATLLIPIKSGQFGKLAATQSTEAIAGKFKLPEFSPLNEEDGKAYGRIASLCDSRFDGKSGGSESALLAIFGALLKPLFGFVFHKADKAIDSALEEYKAEWSGGITTSWFHTTGEGKVEPIYRCLRLVRVSERADQPDDVAVVQFDAILLVHWVPENMAWQLVPMRVFTRNPVARGDKVKFAASIAGSAPAVVEGRGETQAIQETVILKGAYKVVADKSPTQGAPKAAYPVDLCSLVRQNVRLADSAVGAKLVRHPLRTDCNANPEALGRSALVSGVTALAIPGAAPVGSNAEGSAVNLAVKVAEAGEGKRKGRLESWKVFLGKAGDGLSDALTTAITGLIDGKSDE